MITSEAFEAAKNGFRLRRRGWPSDKFMIYDFEPSQGFTIRDSMGWQTDLDPDNNEFMHCVDWEVVTK